MWLVDHLVEFMAAGSILIFVTKKANAEELHNNLKLKEYDALLLHGDMDQIDRNKVIGAFRKKECNILVATDVAGASELVVSMQLLNLMDNIFLQREVLISLT